MKTVSIKKAIELIFRGATNIKLKKMYNCDGEEKSGFFEVGNQIYYLNYQSKPLAGLSKVMYRTAKHTKDFTGGQNTCEFEKNLAGMGYSLK